MSDSKTCKKCLQSKPVNEFGKSSKSKDGLRSQCKSCNNQYANNWYLNNRDKHAINGANWVAKNPEKSRLLAAARQRKFRKQNPQKAFEATKNWVAKNPDKKRAYNLKRLALRKGASAFLVTNKDIEKIMAKNCIYCGSKSEHLDHVIPLSRGGNHSVGNLVAACKKCNLQKNNKFITEWKKG